MWSLLDEASLTRQIGGRKRSGTEERLGRHMRRELAGDRTERVKKRVSPRWFARSAWFAISFFLFPLSLPLPSFPRRSKSQSNSASCRFYFSRYFLVYVRDRGPARLQVETANRTQSAIEISRHKTTIFYEHFFFCPGFIKKEKKISSPQIAQWRRPLRPYETGVPRKRAAFRATGGDISRLQSADGR